MLSVVQNLVVKVVKVEEKVDEKRKRTTRARGREKRMLKGQQCCC